MMRPVVRGLNKHRGMGGMPINLSEFSDRTCQIADSVFDSLLASNDLLPVQWAAALRRRVESRELRLLREVFTSAWEDLASPDDRVCSEAEHFFNGADAGEPLSLRFLCEVFELDLGAVQSIARARIEARVESNEQRRSKVCESPRNSLPR
jgi:hypothetical protein